MFEQCIFQGRYVNRILIFFGAIACILVGVNFLPELIDGATISDLAYDLRDATSEDPFSTRTAYFLTELRVMATYLRLAILPVGQRLDYDYPEYFTLLNLEVFASAVLHLTLVLLALLLYLRSRNQLSDANEKYRLPQRLIVIGIAWFYIALSVTSSFIPIPDDIAEHRMYLPSAGLFIALAGLVQLIAEISNGVLRHRKLGLSILCLVLALATISRNHVWGDEVHFWQNEVRLSPNNARPYGNLGFAYLREDNYELALQTFAKALNLDPSLQEVWIALGSTLQGMGLYPGRFTTGEEYLTSDDDLDYRYYKLFYGSAFNTMGLTKEFIGQPEEALVWYDKSLDLNPEADITWYNLGLLSLRLGNTEQVNIARNKLKELNSQLAGDL